MPDAIDAPKDRKGRPQPIALPAVARQPGAPIFDIVAAHRERACLKLDRVAFTLALIAHEVDELEPKARRLLASAIVELGEARQSLAEHIARADLRQLG